MGNNFNLAVAVMNGGFVAINMPGVFQGNPWSAFAMVFCGSFGLYSFLEYLKGRKEGQ